MLIPLRVAVVCLLAFEQQIRILALKPTCTRRAIFWAWRGWVLRCGSEPMNRTALYSHAKLHHNLGPSAYRCRIAASRAASSRSRQQSRCASAAASIL